MSTIHPVLVKGMHFPTREGALSGCFSNWSMEVLDTADFLKPTDKTFVLGYFDEAPSLKHWGKQHKTHLGMFAPFGECAAELQNHVQLNCPTTL